MFEKITATELRRNIYKILDKVLHTRVPLEIERKGKRLLIMPADGQSSIDRIEPHPDCIPGDPEELVHMDWSANWKGEL